MDLRRSETGAWTLENADPGQIEAKPDYHEAITRYLTVFDPLFERAQASNEFNFVHTLVPVFGLQGPGWDPYETTIEVVEATVEVVNGVTEFAPRRHLMLWLWGHIVEASAPYEMLARLLTVVDGDRPRMTHFPDENGRPLSPWKKAEKIKAACERLGFADVPTPLIEIWNGPLRNAVFHADYSLFGGEVRVPSGYASYSHDEVERLIARANAYHDALKILRNAHIASYTEPVRVSAYGFCPDPADEAVVIVREGHGAVGLKDGYTPEQLAVGAIPFRLGVFLPGEAALLDANPQLAVLPEWRPSGAEEGAKSAA